jgi:hypothetical protein
LPLLPLPALPLLLLGGLWSKSLGLSEPLCSLSLAVPPATRRMCVGLRAAANAGLWVMATIAPLKPWSAPAFRGWWGVGGGG